MAVKSEINVAPSAPTGSKIYSWRLPVFTKLLKYIGKLDGKPFLSVEKIENFYCFIKLGEAPQYLGNLIPPSIQNISTYPLKNGSDIMAPFCRLSLIRILHLYPLQLNNGTNLIRPYAILIQFLDLKVQLEKNYDLF